MPMRFLRRRKASPYDRTFFAGHEDGSARSAGVIVPLVLSAFPINSVVDVGCGVGAWLAEFSRAGVGDFLGVDGDHVPRDLLRIPLERFHAADLTSFVTPDRQFDMACSLETAEHLAPACAGDFIAALVRLAPIVLFSAAIPGQGGTGHINEQWQSYWADLFARHGYVGVDCVRPLVFGDRRVELWYRQNVIVFCAQHAVPPSWKPMASPFDFDRVDPELFLAKASRE